MKTVYHKRGTTYRLSCQVSIDGAPLDLTNVLVRSQLRQDNHLAHEFRIVITNPGAGTFIIEESFQKASVQWSASVYQQDIIYVINGDIIATETFQIQILPQVTQVKL